MTLFSSFRNFGRRPSGGFSSAGGWAFSLLVGLSALSLTPARADTLTPKAAMKVMAQAGYSGVGGVIHDKNFYYAAAMSPRHRRVRVTVDADTGKIVAVVPLRGSGAPPVVPALQSQAPLPVIRAPAAPTLAPYEPPPAVRPVGRTQYPFNSAGQIQPGWCRFHSTSNAPGC
jgi:hypothetical protein